MVGILNIGFRQGQIMVPWDPITTQGPGAVCTEGPGLPLGIVHDLRLGGTGPSCPVHKQAWL